MTGHQTQQQAQEACQKTQDPEQPLEQLQLVQSCNRKEKLKELSRLQAFNIPSQGYPTKIKWILTFTSSPKPCASDPFGLLRQVVWWQKGSGKAALGQENLPAERVRGVELLFPSPLVPK